MDRFAYFLMESAYLWFSGGMRKTYAFLYPGVLAVWAALTYALEEGYEHFEFMDAGFHSRSTVTVNFILRFGGKQSSTRRWFRFRLEVVKQPFMPHVYLAAKQLRLTFCLSCCEASLPKEIKLKKYFFI